MKFIKIYVILLLLFMSAFANDIPGTSSETNLSNTIQTETIKALKLKIEKLETALEKCKQVKPVAGTPLLNHQVEPSVSLLSKTPFLVPKKAPETLSTYYTAAVQPIEVVKEKLASNGFVVLSDNEILPGKSVISFTSKALLHTNSFMSVLHLLVNENKEIRVQNPSYFAAAFLQEKYHYGDFNSTLHALDNALGGLYETEDKYKRSDLAGYHFMIGMPTVNERVIIARADDLLVKLDDVNASKHIAYRLALPNGAILVGHILKQSTYAYLKTIKAEKNALLFPYQAMIKNNKVSILAPKYYLALSLPLLSMTDFLKIASAPKAIEEDIAQAYK